MHLTRSDRDRRNSSPNASAGANNDSCLDSSTSSRLVHKCTFTGWEWIILWDFDNLSHYIMCIRYDLDRWYSCSKPLGKFLKQFLDRISSYACLKALTVERWFLKLKIVYSFYTILFFLHQKSCYKTNGLILQNFITYLWSNCRVPISVIANAQLFIQHVVLNGIQLISS